MAVFGRNRLLRRVAAVLLMAAVINACCFPERPAEAFIDQIVAGIVIVAMEVVVNFFMDRLNDAAGDGMSTVATTYLHEGMTLVEMHYRHLLEKDLYEIDHKRFTGDNVNVGSDAQKEHLTDYYGMAGLTDDNFDGANPGYRDVSAGRFINFHEIYRERVKRLSEHGMVKLLANRAAALAVTDPDNPIPDAAQAVHDNLMWAGEHVDGGYTQMLQAENHTHTLANNLQVPALKAITTVRNDAAIRYAINERQEKADKVAAFEQAVRQWNVLEPNPGY